MKFSRFYFQMKFSRLYFQMKLQVTWASHQANFSQLRNLLGHITRAMPVTWARHSGKSLLQLQSFDQVSLASPLGKSLGQLQSFRQVTWDNSLRVD